MASFLDQVFFKLCFPPPGVVNSNGFCQVKWGCGAGGGSDLQVTQHIVFRCRGKNREGPPPSGDAPCPRCS